MNKLIFNVKHISPKGTGSFVAVLSAPTVDRDGEIIDPKAFEPLPESVPIHVDHESTVDKLVGRGRPFYDGPVLMLEGTFRSHTYAQDIRQAVIEGDLSTMSVGFMAAQRYTDEQGITHISRGELLEASFVSIPSNREALVLAAKAFDAKGAQEALSRAVSLAEAELEGY